MRLDSLKFRSKDVDQQTKWMEVRDVLFDLNSRKFGERVIDVLIRKMFSAICSTLDEGGRYVIAEVGVILHGHWPEVYMNGSRLLVRGVEEGCTCACNDVTIQRSALPF